MKHETFNLSTRDDQPDCADCVRQYFGAHRDALWHVARLLGGYEAARNVGRLAEDLERQAPISRRTKRLLEDLLDLLQLKNVSDPDRVEMGYFAVIDPSDPVVEEICILTDGLAQVIDEMRAQECDLGHESHAQRGAA
ncbi:hypothetical protein [Roseovarius nanhaiticus]|uniref:hypothetical protein n=1 Tax=Roseovarius nanhaiticus TaxID=573024 RepID=UPI0024910809|nr:hypothetical protein [Roseovarius nanhaiticus]